MSDGTLAPRAAALLMVAAMGLHAANDALVKASELTVQRQIVQGLVHGRIAQPEPLLKIVNAQHRLDGKGLTTRLGTRTVRLDDLYQRTPRHHLIHLVEELALARLLRR